LCFTGGIALTAGVDDSVLAPAVTPPALPLPSAVAQRRHPGLPNSELSIIA
jgi:hypothetical protein